MVRSLAPHPTLTVLNLRVPIRSNSLSPLRLHESMSY